MARRILVVDDNPTIVEVLQAYLQADGFEVETAEDGDAAVAAVARRIPDLALLDVMLPGIDGIELTRRFQRDHALPIILVTARNDDVDRLIGLEVGADDYISKPFNPREVVARVKAVLRRVDRVDAGEGQRLQIGALAIDPLTRTVTFGDSGEIEFTRTEFDMLHTLARYPGRVFTRMQLMEAAQGDAFEGYERTVDAHVKNIRRKLSEDPKRPHYLHTVTGVGYKLEWRA